MDISLGYQGNSFNLFFLTNPAIVRTYVFPRVGCVLVARKGISPFYCSREIMKLFLYPITYKLRFLGVCQGHFLANLEQFWPSKLEIGISMVWLSKKTCS